MVVAVAPSVLGRLDPEEGQLSKRHWGPVRPQPSIVLACCWAQITAFLVLRESLLAQGGAVLPYIPITPLHIINCDDPKSQVLERFSYPLGLDYVIWVLCVL